MNIPSDLPVQRLYEYLLVINPHEELRHKIEKSRQALTTKYHIQQPQTGRPHICLARFTALPAMEEKIVQRLRWIALAEKPFIIELQDYGSYPMHAVFIKVANQPRVLQLIKNLKQARRLMKAAGDDPHYMQDPHVALAGRIPKEKYLEAMKEYLHKKFTGRMVADAMLLLRRPQQEKRYQVIQRFEFACLPVPAAQGVLF